MAGDKQNEAKVSSTDENKENQSDGGLGLESILHSTKCVAAVWSVLQQIFDRLRS